MMGMYTMCDLEVTMKPETPQEIWDILTRLADRETRDIAPAELHPLFCTRRHRGMFWSSSAYNQGYYEGRRIVDQENRRLSVGFDMKNYDYEIEKFLDFISPHVEAVEHGFYRYEEFYGKAPIALVGGKLELGEYPKDPYESEGYW